METYRERDEGVEVFGWTVAAEMTAMMQVVTD